MHSCFLLISGIKPADFKKEIWPLGARGLRVKPLAIAHRCLKLQLDVLHTKENKQTRRYCQIYGYSTPILFNFMGLLFFSKKLSKFRINVPPCHAWLIGTESDVYNCSFKTNFFSNGKEIKRIEGNYYTSMNELLLLLLFTFYIWSKISLFYLFSSMYQLHKVQNYDRSIGAPLGYFF